MENSFELIIAFLGRDLVTGVVHGIAGALTKLSGATGAATSGFMKMGLRVSEIMAGLGAGMIVAGIGVGVAMFKMAEGAAKFQGQMVLVSTHAGWTRAEVDKFSNSVLNLASVTGKSAEEIAGGLFYVASAGFHGARALEILTAATKEAAMGHTDVAETSRALTSVLLVGIKAASGASRQLTDVNETINLLNETIGHGKMKLSELNAALSTGILESARVFGVGMNEVGGALDVLTNHGMRADEAATRLRMSFALMGAPSGAAMSNLKALGLTTEAAKDQIGAYHNVITKAKLSTSQLATEMREHGLIAAIKLLNEHLHAAGLSADQANALFVRAFGGGRSATAIMALQQHLKEFQGDTDNIKNHAGDFAAKWANYTNTMEAQQNMFNQSVHSTELAIGMALIPVMTKLLQAILPILQKVAIWVQEHSALIAKFAPMAAIILVVVGAVLVLGGVFGMLFFAIGGIVGVVAPVIAAVGALIGFFGGLIGAIGMVISGSATVGEAIFLIAGPVAWVVAGIIALIIIIILVITHFKQVKQVVENVASAIGSAFGAVVKFVSQAIDNVLAFLKANWPIIITIILGPLGFLIAQVILHWDQIVSVIRSAMTTAGNIIHTVVSTIIDIWNAAFKVGTTVFNALAAVFMVVVKALKVVWDVVTTVLRVILIVELIIIMELVRGFQNIWERMSVVVGNVIKALGQAAGWMGDRFKDLFQGVIAILTPFWTGIVNIFNAVRTFIVSVFNNVRTFVITLWNGLWALATAIITKEINGIRNILNFLKNVITTIWNAIYGFLQPIISAIWQFISDKWNAVMEVVHSVQTFIETIISNSWNAVSTAVKNFVTAIWNRITLAFTNIWNTIVSVHDRITHAVSNAWNSLSRTVGDALGNLWHTITSTLGKIAGDALKAAGDIGKSIVDGITNGLKSAWQGLVDTFNSLAKQLPGPIKAVLGIKSPSSVFAQQVGQPIAEGVALGIRGSAKSIHAAGIDAVQDTLEAMSKFKGPTIRSGVAVANTVAVYRAATQGASLTGIGGTSNFGGQPFTARTLADALNQVIRSNTGSSPITPNKSQTVTITINGATDPKAVARAVTDALAEHFD